MNRQVVDKDRESLPRTRIAAGSIRFRSVDADAAQVGLDLQPRSSNRYHASWSCECRQYAGEARGVSSIDASKSCRRLASEHRRCGSAGWRDDHQIALTAQDQIKSPLTVGENRPTWNARAAAAAAVAFTEVFLALVP